MNSDWASVGEPTDAKYVHVLESHNGSFDYYLFHHVPVKLCFVYA